MYENNQRTYANNNNVYANQNTYGNNSNFNANNQRVSFVPVNKSKVDMYVMMNHKYFPPDKIVYLKEKLYSLDEEHFSMITTLDLKDPTLVTVVSLCAGNLGIDRFMLKDIGMGVLKLLTMGCCGILTIVDWFYAESKTKEMNFNEVMARL